MLFTSHKKIASETNGIQITFTVWDKYIYSWQVDYIVAVKLKITNGKGEIMLFKLQRNALQPCIYSHIIVITGIGQVVQLKGLNNLFILQILVIIMFNQ